MKRIMNFQNFQNSNSNRVVEIYKKVNEQQMSSEEAIEKLNKILDRDFREYLKKKMWNKSKEVFYGKDYKGDPSKDDREIIVGGWVELSKKVTMGEFFLDAWQETDQFCDRTLEWIKSGEIGDVWDDIFVYSAWAGAFALATTAIIATGGAALAPSAAFALQYGSVMGITAAGAINASALAGLSWGIAKSVYESPQATPETKRIAELLINKESTIKNLKDELESHSDFEQDWGLDRWLSGIQAMPGYKQGPWKDVEPEKIGHAFSYTIAFYTVKFLEEQIGAIGAKEIILAEEKKSAEPKKEETKTTTPTPTQTTTPTPTQTTTAPTTTTPTPTQTIETQPVSGVKGEVKKSEAVIDDDILSQYDL